MAAGRGLDKSLDIRAMPDELAGLWRCLVVLKGEHFEEILTQPSLGASYLVEISEVVVIFLMSFISSSRKWVSRKSQRWGLHWQNPGHAAPKGPSWGPSPGPWWIPWLLGFYPLILGWLLHILKEGAVAALILFGALVLLFSQLQKWPMPSRATLSQWK